MKIVDVSVTEVQFQYSENKALTSKFNLKNKAKLPIYFKIKTTDSQYFTVKPHHGEIGPSKSVDIEIFVKAIGQRDAEIVSDQKFLISALEITEKCSDDKDFEKFWKGKELSDPSLIESQRLKIAIYREENGIKKFITNSRTDNTLKQSQMYQSVRSNVKVDNNLGTLDQEVQQRKKFEEIGKQYEEAEKKIREQEKERNRLHSQYLKIKQVQNTPEKTGTDKKKVLLMVFLGFIVSYILLK